MDLMSEKKLAIMGAGVIAKVIIDMVGINEIIKRDGCCLVDDGFKRCDFYCGIPVYELAEFLKIRKVEEYCFFNTVTSVSSEEYRRHLLAYGIENVTDINTIGQIAPIAVENVITYLHKKQISTTEENIVIDKFVFPNPFLGGGWI